MTTCIFIYILGFIAGVSYGFTKPIDGHKYTDADFLGDVLCALLFGLLWPVTLGCALSTIQHK